MDHLRFWGHFWWIKMFQSNWCYQIWDAMFVISTTGTDGRAGRAWHLLEQLLMTVSITRGDYSNSCWWPCRSHVTLTRAAVDDRADHTWRLLEQLLMTVPITRDAYEQLLMTVPITRGAYSNSCWWPCRLLVALTREALDDLKPETVADDAIRYVRNTTPCRHWRTM